ncbi:MAG: TraR/DksA C4-type zinc finger protein [Kiritimatiellae bacterium]|nr:TraR/DksA C4-type zinc finger protein [Kiritimatiellia bacterium]
MAAQQKNSEDAAKPAAKPNRKAPVIIKSVPKKMEPVDTAKAVAFAMSIAKEMKRNAKEQTERPESEGIKLTKRPTSRGKGGGEHFPEADLAEFRKKLLIAREEAANGANAMRATGFNESEDHEADGGDGTNQTLRLQALGQMGNINRTIQQIEEALHRIDDGTYGICTVCGQLIRKPRLLNQPFVLTCMECQSAMEKGQEIHQ